MNDTNNKRNRPNQYYLSKDFLILWTVREQQYNNIKNETTTYNVVKIRFAKFKKKQKTKKQTKSQKVTPKPYGKILFKRTIDVKTNDPSKIKAIIFDEIWKYEDLRKIVKEEVLSALANKTINNVTLLLFSYAFYDDICKESRFNKDDFLTIVKDNLFRNIILNEDVEDNITYAIEKYIIKHKGISIYRIELLLNYILRHAYINKIIENKIVLHLENNDNLINAQEKRAYRRSRKALAEKSLSLFSFRELTDWLIDRFKNGEYAYLGVLIELFTGLYPAEVCALQWCDYKGIKYSNGRHHFEITKKMSGQGVELEPIEADRKQAYRLVPLPRIIDELIEIQRNNLLNYKLEQYKKSIRSRLKNKKYNDLIEMLFKALNTNTISYQEFNNIPDKKLHKIFDERIFEETKDYPIVSRSCDKYLKEGEEFMLPLAQKTLRNYNKKAKENGFRKVENKFLMPESKKLNDLNKVQLFRINFQHHATEQGKLTSGEIAYILGNNAPDPYSGHYCDYSNDFVQKKLAEKMDLIVDAIYSVDSVLETGIIAYDEENNKAKKSCLHNITIEAGVGKVASDVITMNIGSDANARIIIENEHGFDGAISSRII
ncbi:MAG: hypothetical protein IJT79_09045 [Ruminococcus sp.]|nr:hypothetical protein [Ruminococcus sp.]